MTPQEKILHLIELALIEKYGDEFLELSERDKYNIIFDTITKYFVQITK
jgi:hypothetical protein